MGKLDELDKLLTDNIDDLLKQLEDKLSYNKDPEKNKSKINELIGKIEEKEQNADTIINEKSNN